MSKTRPTTLSRRTFLQGTGLAGAGTLLAASAMADDANKTLPQRVLGRTKQKVTTLGLGTWPCGKSSDVDESGVVRLVHEALDLGINFIDAAEKYGRSEKAIGNALVKRRDQVFLTSKVWANTAKEATASLEKSLRELRTDKIDLMYIHSVGNRNVKQVMAKDGALEYLLRQKEKGVIRFIGVSGHSRANQFVPLIRTDQIDVIMMPLNFVDRFNYGFEKTVLPLANEHGVGVACMKTFGGMLGGVPAAIGPNPGTMVPRKMLQQAVRFSLGLPGVATLVIGPHTVEQLRENVRWVKSYQPLLPQERTTLLAQGKQLASSWGTHHGPAV